MVEILSCVFVFVIMLMEGVGLLLEYKSYGLYKNYFEERKRWYQSRRKETVPSVAPKSKEGKTAPPVSGIDIDITATNVVKRLPSSGSQKIEIGGSQREDIVVES